MAITDEEKAKTCLVRIGYYRLSAYWYPSRKSERYTDSDGSEKVRVLDDFRDGTTFSDALDFYVFDKKLRLITMDALERIEVAIRTDIAILLGAHGPWAHRDPSKLHGNFALKAAHKGTTDTKLDEWLSRLDDKFKRSKEDFAKHFKQRYPDDDPPIWVAVELWDFGTLSHFFSGMTVSDQDKIAARYGLPSGRTLQTWLRNLNDVRNLCAHHSRLWNRNIASIPSWPSQADVPTLDHLNGQSLSRFHASAVILRHLLRTINPTSSWAARLVDHIATLPQNPYVTLQSGGFPQNWEANWKPGN